jgi:precorrin-6A/cobalt-precorrin-6A reductase
MPGLSRGVLILGGTGEARGLAAALAGSDDWRVVSSLAGRVSSPTLPVGEVRIGGFGGPEALAAWLVAEEIQAVVDATHPFAARITASALAAAPAASVPLLLLRRPGWTAGPGEDWLRVPSVPDAASALRGLDGPVLLTTGRGGLTAFAGLPHRFVVRTVDPPDPPLPRDVELVLARGPYTVAGETDLMRRHAIRVLVTKDSGGDMTAAKLTAARDLGVRVVMVERPDVPGADHVPAVADVAGAVAWLGALHPSRRGGGQLSEPGAGDGEARPAVSAPGRCRLSHDSA